jgi:transglutaminase-like putative cysteine protease
MNQRRHMTIIAAVATLLAAAPLEVVFAQWTWAIDCIMVVAAICATALAARALRAPLWAQPLATLAALLLILTWLNPSGHEFIGILPSPASFRHFGDLLNAAASDIRNLGTPAQDTNGLLMLTTAGVGLCAVVIDFVTVGLRKPALAGLPMLAIYAVPVAVDTHSVNIIPFLIGACGYMWLLVTDNIDRVRLFGRRFTGDGRGVDAWEPSPLAAVGRRIAVIGMILAIIVPAAAPGMTKGFFDAFGGVGGDHPGNGNCGTSCAASSVDLLATLSGQLNDPGPPRVMAVVDTTESQPGYLRLGVAATLTNKGFLSTNPNGRPIGQGLPYPYYNSDTSVGAPGIDFSREHAHVVLSNLDSNRLPVYTQPISGTLSGVSETWRYEEDTSEIFNNDTTTATGEDFQFDYARPNYSLEALRSAQRLPNNNPIQSQFTQVPQRVAQVDAVMNGQLSGDNEYDRVNSLYKYFSAKNNFIYTTATKPGTTGTDIGNFLTEKQGFCIQYAAALAWLVRAADYPARVAFGFTQGTQSTTQPGHFTMTNLNLHAWTEVYFDGFGWLPFDATPAASIVGWSHDVWDPIIDPAINPSTGPSGGLGTGASGGEVAGSPKPKFTDPGNQVGGGAGGGHGDSQIGWYLLGAFAVILIVFLSPFAARMLGRRRRYALDARVNSDSAAPGEPYVVAGDPADATRSRVHAAWDEFVDTLIDFGVPVDYAETPRTAAERVVNELHLPRDVQDNVRLLGAAEQRARYALRPGPTEPLAGPLRSFRRALGARVSFGTRLRAIVLPPSVTQRWRAESTVWWAQTVTRTQATRDRLFRTFSIRRLLASSKRVASGRTGS